MKESIIQLQDPLIGFTELLSPIEEEHHGVNKVTVQ